MSIHNPYDEFKKKKSFDNVIKTNPSILHIAHNNPAEKIINILFKLVIRMQRRWDSHRECERKGKREIITNSIYTAFELK